MNPHRFSPVRGAAGRMRPGAALAVVFLCAGIAALVGGCDEEDSCPACPESGVQLESIYLTADSLDIGGEVQLWALPEADDQEYVWTASAGEFKYVDGNFAWWKAPDVAALARITVVATNEKLESKALGATIAVATYVPRDEPAYTGASYCGLECHGIESHGDNYDTWVASAHAGSFPEVEAHSAYEAEFCAECHTVGYGDLRENGWIAHNGGYDEIQVARLEGVQCENCHGPLADRYGTVPEGHNSLSLSDSLYAVGTAQGRWGCASCHEAYESAAHPQGKGYASEWLAGPHALIPDGVDLGSATCASCHTVQGFIARLDGVSAGAPASPLPITCVGCHDPHGSAWVADLRRGPQADVCSRCHTDESSGYPHEPHAPQAQMLAGTGGAEELVGGAIPSTPHQQVLRQGCGECHYPAEETGLSHTFAADAASCAACHPESNGTDFAWASTLREEIADLTAALEAELAAASPGDSATTVFRQANFNLQFATRDRSSGAHNYEYARQLLESSIAAFTPSTP